MKIDGPFYAQLGEAAAEAERLKAIGYDGIYTLEGSWDPFYPLVMAAEHAPGLDLATGIAVAFPRNPMHLAYMHLCEHPPGLAGVMSLLRQGSNWGLSHRLLGHSVMRGHMGRLFLRHPGISNSDPNCLKIFPKC